MHFESFMFGAAFSLVMAFLAVSHNDAKDIDQGFAIMHGDKYRLELVD